MRFARIFALFALFARPIFPFLRRFVVACAIILCATETAVVFASPLSGVVSGDSAVVLPLQTPPRSSVQIIHAAADPVFSSLFLRARGISGGGAAVNGLSRDVFVRASFGTASLADVSWGGLAPLFDSAIGARFALDFRADSLSPSLASLPFSVGSGRNVVIAIGIFRPLLFMPNPQNVNTNLQLIHLVDTLAVVDTGAVRLNLVHGATDLEKVNVIARETGETLASFHYGQATTATLTAGNYTIDVRRATSGAVVASFYAPLKVFGASGQQAALVLTGFAAPSRNQNGSPLAALYVPHKPFSLESEIAVADSSAPAQDSALASTPETFRSAFLPLAPRPFVGSEPPTTIQIIDNSPDLSRAPLNTFLLARAPNATTTTLVLASQNLRFRQASPARSTTQTVSIAIVNNRPVQVVSTLSFENVVGSQIVALAQRVQNPQAVNAANLPLAVLGRGRNTVIAVGVIDTANYARNPDGISTRLRFTNFIDATDSVDSASARVLLFQGVTDAPRLDFVERGGDTLASLRYAEGTFLTLPARQTTLDISAFGTDDVLGSFLLPLNEYAGRRVCVATSGFRTITANNNGAPLAMTLTPEKPQLPPGAVLPPNPALAINSRLLQAVASPQGVAETTLQPLHLSPDPALGVVGAALRLPLSTNASAFLPVSPALSFRAADTAVTGLSAQVPFLKDLVGSRLTALLTPPRANSAAGAYYEQSFTLARGANILISSGVQKPARFAQNPDGKSTATRFLQFVDRERTIAEDSARILFVHASPDAPRIEARLREIAPAAGGEGSPADILFGALGYGEGAWTTAPLADYILDILPAGDSAATARPLFSYRAPLKERKLGGQRLTIAATGFLHPAQNQALHPFGVWAYANTPSYLIEGTTATATTASLAIASSLEIAPPEAPDSSPSASNIFAAQAFPNPASAAATLFYALKESDVVGAVIADAKGAVLQVVQAAAEREAGAYSATFSVDALPAGAYDLRITSQKTGATTIKFIVAR